MSRSDIAGLYGISLSNRATFFVNLKLSDQVKASGPWESGIKI